MWHFVERLPPRVSRIIWMTPKTKSFQFQNYSQKTNKLQYSIELQSVILFYKIGGAI